MLRRVATTVGGVILLLYGVIAGVSPLPAGVVFVVLGFLMIAAANPAARPALRRLRRRWPWFNAVVKSFAQRGPKSLRSAADVTDPAELGADETSRPL